MITNKTPELKMLIQKQIICRRSILFIWFQQVKLAKENCLCCHKLFWRQILWKVCNNMAKTYTKVNVLAKGINISCAAKTSLNCMNAFKVTPNPKIHCR